MKRISLLLAVCAALLNIAFGLQAYAGANDKRSNNHWVGTWSASPHVPTPIFVAPASEIHNQTIRNIVHISVGGSAIRLHLTNAFGTQPITFNSVYAGIQESDASLVPGSNHAITFAGKLSITIPAGAEALSDPVLLIVDHEQNLAISLFSAESTGRPTTHSFAQQTNYLSVDGDHASAHDGAAFTVTSTSWYFVSGVDVLAPSYVKGAVVTLGDSITDGLASTVDANERWPDFLARRLLAAPPGHVMSVLNQAITGNRVLNDSTCFGANAVARFDRDVLAQTGITHLIVLEATNDLGFPTAPDVFFSECFLPRTSVSVQQIIAGYQQLAVQSHAKGLKVFVGTITPFKGFLIWTPEAETRRQAINDWIRGNRDFDGFIDFAAAVADSSDPSALSPQYDSGDHAHVNAAGAEALADAIDLSIFR